MTLSVSLDCEEKENIGYLCFFCGSRALFTGPVCTDFSEFFFKTESQGTIHTFKNYFAIVFSVLSFNKISSTQTDP